MLRPKAHKGGEGTFLRVMGPVSAILILNKFKVSMVPSFLPFPYLKKKKNLSGQSICIGIGPCLSFCKLLFCLNIIVCIFVMLLENFMLK